MEAAHTLIINSKILLKNKIWANDTLKLYSNEHGLGMKWMHR
jgi:hypothetical protein